MRPVPLHVRLNIAGIEVPLQEPGKFRQVLVSGYSVHGPVWDIFPRRRHPFMVATKDSIGLACDVCDIDDGWEIGCGSRIYEVGHVRSRSIVNQ